MGICPVGHHGIRERKHLGRDVGVVVQAHDDRHGVAHDCPDPPKDLCFCVVEQLVDHGAVQVQENSVNRHVRRHGAGQFADDPLERVIGDRAAGAAAGPHEWDSFVLRAHRLEESRHGERVAGQALEQVLAAHQWRAVTMLRKMPEVGPVRRERVCLVLKTTDCDTRHGNVGSQSRA